MIVNRKKLELLANYSLDILAGEDSWKKRKLKLMLKSTNDLRHNQNSPRGEGGVGFVVHERLVNVVYWSAQISEDSPINSQYNNSHITYIKYMRTQRKGKIRDIEKLK